jgi:hypothetical protein
MQARLANKELARDAWESICRIRVGADRVKEANAERLRQDFAKIKFKPSECVEDFSIHITALANELRVLGDEITDKEVVKKLLHSVLEKLEQVTNSMETLLDLNSLSIEEATDHLRVVEQRKKPSTSPVTDTDGRLLLTEEEWSAWMKAKEKGRSSCSGAPVAPTVAAAMDAVTGKARAVVAAEMEAQILVHAMNRRVVMHATTVANQATGPRIVDPRPGRVRPMRPTKKSPFY